MLLTKSENSVYTDSTILVTGGTGSIGLELAKTLLNYKPKKILLFDNDENGLFEARSLLRMHPEVLYKLGDVTDTRSIESVIKDCDYVFHAAARKHVDFCEGNPYEAISTNVLGTQITAECAIKYGIKKFVFISTDKSVNPISVLGTTKLLGERLVVSSSKSTSRPIFSVVRFGNVLGSRGSAVLIFDRQVKSGCPLTVTNPEMTRFIMLPSDAAKLVLHAAELANSGEIFVLKMNAVKVNTLIKACRVFFSELYNKDSQTIKIIKTGANPGEKMHEELMTATEAANVVETEKYYIINPHPGRLKETAKPAKGSVVYTSDLSNLISEKEIITLLSRLYSNYENCVNQK
ncbi:MAG: SDR family NAD(P)-dependent oxidoreductase [Candidatus Bathyarchaeia archaeon]|jgi:FlaA1/EpsC-like NDP-sugar epimerase